MAIALIDYRAGNLTSVRKGFAAVGAELYTPSAAADLARADGIVVPGVGHFGATAFLDDAWRSEIQAAVADGRPLLGICLGLQWLFDGSEEAPLPGLGAIEGQCTRLRPIVKVPHVGWNSLEVTRPSALLDGIPDGTQVYFTHSYAAPVTAALRRRDDARRKIRRRSRARSRVGRSVPSRKVGTSRPEDPGKLHGSCQRTSNLEP